MREPFPFFAAALLWLVLLCVPFSSWANSVDPTGVQCYVTANAGGFVSSTYGTCSEACSAEVQYYDQLHTNPVYTETATTCPVTGGGVVYSTSAGTYNYSTAHYSGTPVCPSGYQYNSQTGYCDSVQNTCPTANTQSGNYGAMVVGGSSDGNTYCINGCSYNGGGGGIGSTQINGTWVGYVGSSTGQSCSTTGAQTYDTPTSCAASGQGYISNGNTTTCVASSTGSSSPTNTSSASAVPSAPSIGCAGPNCVSGASYGNGGGPTGSGGGGSTAPVYDVTYSTSSSVPQTITTNPIADYCSANPTADICKKVTCDPLKDASCLGAAPAPDTIPTVNPTFYDPSTNTVPFAQVNSCPAEQDYPFSVSGRTFTFKVDWQPWCNFASTVKPIFLALGAVLAAFIFAAGLTL